MSEEEVIQAAAAAALAKYDAREAQAQHDAELKAAMWDLYHVHGESAPRIETLLKTALRARGVAEDRIDELGWAMTRCGPSPAADAIPDHDRPNRPSSSSHNRAT